MALRPRLVAPPPAPSNSWPWHILKHRTLPASTLFTGDRRMEAEGYLSSGFALRNLIESRPSGWTSLRTVAHCWQPSRLKGIQVSREFGIPFLAATQAFDVRPVARKWLSLDRTEDASQRFVAQGTILVTCSGSVGRPTLACAPLANTLISHDLLRVEPRSARDWGWIYAYLHAPQTRAMSNSVQYGHIIKHLETAHLDALPLPILPDEVAAYFNMEVAKILQLRNDGHRLLLEAEARFSEALGIPNTPDWGENGFSVRAADALYAKRRRFDATFHNPGVSALRTHLQKHGRGFEEIGSAGYDLWLPGRFRRIPAEDGVLLVDSGDLTEINPNITRRIADIDFGDPYQGRIRAGWILMARSGQTYGVIGSAVLAGRDLEDKVVTDDVIRLRPRADALIRPGYLVIALSHPILGRPLVKSLAYGSSIPHIEVSDLSSLNVVRLALEEEEVIAELAEASAESRASADLLEQAITSKAEEILDAFIGGT